MSYSMRASGNCTCPCSSQGSSCSRAQSQNLVEVAIRPAIAVVAVAIPFLEELLIVGLQLVLEDDAVDVRALFVKALGLLEICPIELRIVLQLARPLNAVMEVLPFAGIVGRPSRFEKVAAFLRQRDHRRVAIDADGLHQAGLAQMPQLAVTRVERLVEGVAQVVGAGDAEGADAAQRARLRAAQRVVVAVIVDVLAFEAAREIDAVHEHIARVWALSLSEVIAAAAAAAEVTRAIIERARVVAPTRIVHLAPPSKTAANTGLSCCPTETPTQSRTSPRNQPSLFYPAKVAHTSLDEGGPLTSNARATGW